MKAAVWFFLWAIDKTTSEIVDPDAPGKMLGVVLGGQPQRDDLIAEQFGADPCTARNWRRLLVTKKYLKQRRTPWGNVLWVRNSQKWLKNRAVENYLSQEEVSGKKLPNRSVEFVEGSVKKVEGWTKNTDAYRQDSDSTGQDKKRESEKPALPPSTPNGQELTPNSCPPEDLTELAIETAVEANRYAQFSEKAKVRLQTALVKVQASKEEVLTVVPSMVLEMDDHNLKNAGSGLATSIGAQIKRIRKANKKAAKDAAIAEQIHKEMKRQAEEKHRQIVAESPAEITHVPDDSFCSCPTCEAANRKAEVA
jgi:hypothetical protein